jgi:phage-related minor tail protein
MSADRPGLADIDLVELGEMLEFLHDLIASAPNVIAAVLHRFVGAGYSLEELKADLARFAFLVGGDGERLFGSEQ